MLVRDQVGDNPGELPARLVQLGDGDECLVSAQLVGQLGGGQRPGLHHRVDLVEPQFARFAAVEQPVA